MAKPLEPGEMSRLVTRILSAFESTASSIACDDPTHQKNRVHQDAVRDSLERFKLWNGSLGADHPPSDPKSLEYRLQTTPLVSKGLYELLSDLKDDLQKGVCHGALLHGHLAPCSHCQSMHLF